MGFCLLRSLAIHARSRSLALALAALASAAVLAVLVRWLRSLAPPCCVALATLAQAAGPELAALACSSCSPTHAALMAREKAKKKKLMRCSGGSMSSAQAPPW
jgi:hypothetical protein